MTSPSRSREGPAVVAPPIPPQEFADRRARAVELAGERGFEALLVWSRNATTADWYGDVLYLSNHHTPFPQQADNPPLWSGRGHSVLILPVAGEPVLAIDTYEYREDLLAVDDVRVGLNLPALVAGVLTELGLDGQPLGLVGRESLLLSSYVLLRQALGSTPRLTAADDLLAELRRRKSPAELDLMRSAAGLGAECMVAMLDAVHAGHTEGDVAGEGWRAAAQRGVFPYDTAIASGANSGQFQWARLPSWDSRRPLAHGDLIHVDLYGPAIEGYCTDFVRSTVVGGEPSPAQRELLDGAVEHVETIINAIRPGVTFGELWRIGDAWRAANGFVAGALDANFPAFGHCIGLGALEAPYITDGNASFVEEDMVMAVETLLSLPGVGGAGFEQDVIVTATGCETITDICPARRW